MAGYQLAIHSKPIYHHQTDNMENILPTELYLQLYPFCNCIVVHFTYKNFFENWMLHMAVAFFHHE